MFLSIFTEQGATAVETAAYALLAAVALKERQQAHTFAHWLTTQENFYGGFWSSQVHPNTFDISFLLLSLVIVLLALCRTH